MPISHPFLPPLPLEPSGCKNPPCVSVLCEICEFGASGVEVLEVSFQESNAQFSNSLITSLCYSIIVLCW